ncbi:MULTISPECIES: D-arabinono-1,4-lactone oxidase [Tenacibaculum]|uniref:D-arabinono-1,4-lactone oxidase n=1 Tax=Tenacibaculum TaxID=104267 RepID=UPI001F0A9892|nr:MULTISPECIES: D-arabinono-1,4-lactone oxidase [Tenacibaculum]MCH3880883.1 FAD-binding protein [Tenacibaculum aquimarinum]MDO6599518.1 D-arabinono-1,4-lactone oxidase [Tenacibaculum sp. 1_MG-2023]
MNQDKSGVWNSWNENISYNYKSLYKINSEEELQEVVRNSEKIRVFGNKQSSSDIVSGASTLVDIKTYNKILSFNDSEKTVTVQSGVILGDLLEVIEARGWCIPCLPDINTITIGGALTTGTHGTSGKLLSEYITKCTIILADGSLKEITEKEELIHAVRVSLGVLGVLSEITFKCEDIYTLHVKEGPENDSDWLPKIKERLKKHDFLRILWLPHTDKGYVIIGDKISADTEIKENLGPKFLKHRRKASKILYKYTHVFPWITAIANKLLYRGFFSSTKEHKGSLYQATVTKSRGSTLELAEWTIGLDKFPKVFEELKTEINKWSNKSFIHIPMDIRFIYKDTSWLSYAYKKDTVTMGCVSRNAATADSYEAFKSIEKIFLKYGGKPHWGKRFTAKDAELSKIYDKWEDFKILRKELDPNNKFLNPYLAELFNEKPSTNETT